ncbi:Lipid phosphate phosphatase 1 [Hibiscus syriacus]|uniref:Lipid phosphate phosphatase 1 n=1 Tax=Hibiscus syriacus TaxID=106335 RepID=A0A6A2YZC5_HIBSY|nr:Lipid phosphate phosphatase 1 [Hibiscus syriacus]
MQEVHLGSHTIRSHGVAVGRTHMHDWLILLLLVVIEVILYIIHPFYRFVGKDMMEDLRYPFKSNTVPVWAVPMYAMLLPMLIFLVVYIRRRDVYDLHHAVLGLLFSILVTAVITDSIKNAVGRPRPDFFWRCFPDGKDDEFAGGLLGLVVSAFCYLQFFPPPYDANGWGTYAYFRVLEESTANTTNTANAGNLRNATSGEIQIANQQEGRHDNGFMGMHLARDADSTMGDMESGKSQLGQLDALIPFSTSLVF